MQKRKWASSGHLAAIVRRCLAEGKRIEIDGLGLFVPDARKGFRFLSRARPAVFIAYVQEDAAAAERLYDDLAKEGFNPWMDRRKLLPGQNWPRAIEDAIERANYFVACFSSRSVRKKGGFQAEIRYALDCARRAPLDDIFIVPVRLDECRVPAKIQRELQYVDLFPDWRHGVARVAGIMNGGRGTGDGGQGTQTGAVPEAGMVLSPSPT